MTIARLSIPFALLLAFAPAAYSDSFDLYSNLPSPLPGNIVSLGYEANGAYEFGGLIQLAGGNTLGSATVVMSDWALGSDWASNGTTITSSGFYVPLTLSLYNVSTNNTVGAQIMSDTVNAFIPWRPEASPGCGAGSTKWMASDGNCYNGSLSTVTFDLGGVATPSEIIYGLSFNTTNHGASPTGVQGPYDSLNFGLTTATPTVGSNPDASLYYWNSGSTGDTYQPYTGLNDGSNPYTGVIQFSGPVTTPEPSSLLLLGTGLLTLAGVVQRRSRLRGAESSIR